MQNLQKFKITQMVHILTILPVGIENLEKLAWIAQILRSSGQGSVNWVDFVQFAVNFESSIYHGANQKMVLRILHYLRKRRAFWLLGGVYMDFKLCACA